MKKSQSIFLLSGLVPLVAAPIAIVASCSSDTTTSTTQTEAGKEVARLNEVIKSNKLKIKEGTIFDQAKLDDLKNNPNKLLTDYLVEEELQLQKDKFDYSIEGLNEPKATTEKTLNFRIKVTSKTTPAENATTDPATVTYQFGELTPLEKEVAKIEAAHADGSFKLKADKQTIPQDQISQLTAANFLSNYVDGLPTLTSGFTPSVKDINFNISDKGTKDKTQVIKFKVTVSETATKAEQDTKELSFEFTLQEAAPITANDVKDEIEKLETAKTFKLKAGKETLTQAEVTALPGKSATFISEYTQGLTLKDGFNYVVEGLKVENSKFKQGQQPQPTTKFVKFQIKVTNKTNNSETATTREFSWQITETTN